MTNSINPSMLTQEQLNRLENAGRGTRLVASVLDSIFIMIIIVPTMWFTGGLENIHTAQAPTLAYSVGIGIFGYIVFLALNGKLLLQNGQTLGKKLQNIRIVTLDDEQPLLYPHLLKRYAVFFLIGYVPYIGSLLSIGNLLSIFGKQKKCGHDHFALTKVVKN